MKKHPGLIKGAVLALAIGASVLPAQAATFGLHFGTPGGRIGFPVICQTDYQVRQNIAAEGFTNIFLNAPNDRHIQVRATQGRWVYLIDYNRCRGEIVSMQRLRRAG